MFFGHRFLFNVNVRMIFRFCLSQLGSKKIRRHQDKFSLVKQEYGVHFPGKTKYMQYKDNTKRW